MPKLLLSACLVILTAWPAAAIPLRGDWESSGDLPYLYEPVYPFAYECQAEVSDGRRHLVEGEERAVYAVARFRLEKGSVVTRDLRWVPVIRDFETGDRRIAGPVPFTIDDAWVALSFRQETPDDGVALRAWIGLKIGDFDFGDDGRGDFRRGDAVLRADAAVSARRRDGGPGLYRRLYVECDKVR